MKVAEKEGGSFEPIPVGIHNAMCIGVIGIGEQEFMGKTKTKVIVFWEMMDLKEEKDGEKVPRVHSEFLTASLGNEEYPTALRKILQGWRGKPFTPEELAGFEMRNIVGVPCVLMMKTKDNGKGTQVAEAMRYSGDKYTPHFPALFYDPEEHDEAVFQKIPEWIRERINRPGAQVAGMTSQPDTPVTGDIADDNIPF